LQGERANKVGHVTNEFSGVTGAAAPVFDVAVVTDTECILLNTSYYIELV
jgi:hypothetical protein